MSIDLDVLSKIVSSSHLSISKSRSTGLLFICAAHHLKLIKGQMLFRADIGIDNLPKIVIAAPVTF